MSIGSIAGKPGVQTTYTATPRELFYGNRQDARFIPGPVTIDGTASGNAANSPYVWNLWAGQAVGKVTATGNYATSILGSTTAAVISGATTVTTSAAVATELVRRGGASGTFTLTGPPTAAGTVAATVITYSAVNTTTGVITCTATAVAKVTACWIQPVDGSETIVTFLTAPYGLKVIDSMFTTRVDAFAKDLWAGGGIVNIGSIVNYPADASLKTYLKAAIRLNVPNAGFSDDLANA